MGFAVVACLALVMLTTLLHYEALRLIGDMLPRLRMAPRARLIVVILGTFAAHALEIALYAAAMWVLVRGMAVGALGRAGGPSWSTALYFSAETFTSLGYGDVVPQGALRALAGVEALNGLLLIGWTASYTYIEMQHFWSDSAGARGAPTRH